MAFSGKTIKYRIGDQIDTCSLYNVETDALENDIAIPVTIDNTTLYLIGVDETTNKHLYALSSLTYEHEGSSYTIAKSKFKSKTFELFYSGKKYDPLSTTCAALYNTCLDNITSGGHSDYLTVSRTPTGVQIVFNNVYDSFVESYTLIGSGGNGGRGGSAKTVVGPCTTVTYYGGGGGGGEAGESVTSSIPIRADTLVCEYASSLGEVRFKALYNSATVRSKSATYGANGANANNNIAGAGGSGRTNWPNGKSGENGFQGKVGTGGAGGIITGTSSSDPYRFGYGSRGSNGSSSTNGLGLGATGGPWLIKVRLLYYVKLSD